MIEKNKKVFHISIAVLDRDFSLLEIGNRVKRLSLMLMVDHYFVCRLSSNKMMRNCLVCRKLLSVA